MIKIENKRTMRVKNKGNKEKEIKEQITMKETRIVRKKKREKTQKYESKYNEH